MPIEEVAAWPWPKKVFYAEALAATTKSSSFEMPDFDEFDGREAVKQLNIGGTHG